MLAHQVSELVNQTKNKPKCLTVIKKKKTLLDYITNNFNKSDNIIISTGYKSNLIEKHLSNKSIKYVRNKNYLKTNMVESLILCKSSFGIKEISILAWESKMYPLLISFLKINTKSIRLFGIKNNIFIKKFLIMICLIIDKNYFNLIIWEVYPS